MATRSRQDYHKYRDSSNYDRILSKKKVHCSNEKSIDILLKCNVQGHYLNIYEKDRNGTQCSKIVINEDMFDPFREILDRFVKHSRKFIRTTENGTIASERLYSGSRSYTVEVCRSRGSYYVRLSLYAGHDQNIITFPLEDLPTLFQQYSLLITSGHLTSNNRTEMKHTRYLAKQRDKNFSSDQLPAAPNTSTNGDTINLPCPLDHSHDKTSRQLQEQPIMVTQSVTHHPLDPVLTTHEIINDTSLFRFQVKKKASQSPGEVYVCVSEIDICFGEELGCVTIPESCWLEISEVFRELSNTHDDDQSQDHAHDLHETCLPHKKINTQTPIVDEELRPRKIKFRETPDVEPVRPRSEKKQEYKYSSFVGKKESLSISQTRSTNTVKTRDKPWAYLGQVSATNCLKYGGRQLEDKGVENLQPSIPFFNSSFVRSTHGRASAVGGGSSNRYVEDLEDFIQRVSGFWKQCGDKPFPSPDKTSKWKVYYVYENWFGHYSLMFEYQRTRTSFIIQLLKNVDTNMLELSFRVIDFNDINYPKLKRNYLGTTEMSGNEILLRAYRVMKIMGPYNVLCNNCQDFVKKLSKELCLDVSVIRGRDVGVAVGVAGAGGVGIVGAAVTVGIIALRLILRF